MRVVKKIKRSLIVLVCIVVSATVISFGGSGGWSPSVKSFHDLIRNPSVTAGTSKACVYAKDVEVTTKEINNFTEGQLIDLIVQRSEYSVRTQPCTNLANELSDTTSPQRPLATLEPGVQNELQDGPFPSSEGESVDKEVTLKLSGTYSGDLMIDVHIVYEEENPLHGNAFHHLQRNSNSSVGTDEACVYFQNVTLTTKEINESTEASLKSLILQKSAYSVRTQPCTNLANELSDTTIPKRPQAIIGGGIKGYLTSGAFPTNDGMTLDKEIPLDFQGSYTGSINVLVHIIYEKELVVGVGTDDSNGAETTSKIVDTETPVTTIRGANVGNNGNGVVANSITENENSVETATNEAITSPKLPTEFEMEGNGKMAFAAILILGIAAISVTGFAAMIFSDLRLIFWYNRRK